MNCTELSTRPSPAHYENQAKDLFNEQKLGDPLALRRLKQNCPRLEKVPENELLAAPITLADAQLTIAREHGFENWAGFVTHIDAMNRDSSISKFEAAVEAIVRGDEKELSRLLRENPSLVSQRSTRRHRATLLNYTGTNGVENYRQKNPQNIVALAEMLLKAGADINAVCDAYGGSDTLGLAATSYHPAKAGVQEALLELLIRHGAILNPEIPPNETHRSIVNSCLANGRGKAAEYLAARGVVLDIAGAAGAGRLDTLKTFFDDDGSPKSSAKTGQMESGFLWACQFGRTNVVEFLLKKGLRGDELYRGESGLHWAAYNAHADIVKLLLGKNNTIDLREPKHGGGTPLGWALYGWCDPSLNAEPGRYYETVALLTGAGATPDWNWIDHARRERSIRNRMEGDPQMVAALRGNVGRQPSPKE